MFERLSRNPKMDTSSDARLHQAAQQGSEKAMATLYRQHGALIYRFSLRMCQDPAIAEEVTQEVFMALMQQGERFDPARAALSTWLCGIARRQVWKHLEKRQRDLPGGLSECDDEDEGFEAASPDDDPATVLTRQEAVTMVRRGIDELPSHLREVIVLCEFEEMTYEEAALIIAVPVGTIRSRLHRARLRLKSLLQCEPASGGKEKLR